MRTLIIIILGSFLQSNKVSCQLGYGSVFPIPLTITNKDPNFRYCSIENGVYVHTTNCSLFHLCTFGIHTIYSCIDGFFFNPISSQCQHLPIETDVKCETILQKMMNMDSLPLIESIKNYNSHHHRKSATSKCTQTGIYPDILDCSLFHYCHENNYHEILKCPNGLNFDPKTFMCLAPQLVNCQYEPSTRTEDEIDTICRDYAPGTYLPISNRFDAFIICGNNGKSISMKCKSGFIYNALTTACEDGPCTFDSTLCQNEGQCIDEPTIEKGFKCICSNQFQGEYCEKAINLDETTEQVDIKEIMKKNSDNLVQKSSFDQTTHVPYIEKVNLFRKNKSIIINKTSNDLLEDKSLLHSSSEQQQQQQFEQMIKMVSIITIILIGLILLGSIVFSIRSLTRFILYSSVKTIGEWKTLQEESNI